MFSEDCLGEEVATVTGTHVQSAGLAGTAQETRSAVDTTAGLRHHRLLHPTTHARLTHNVVDRRRALVDNVLTSSQNQNVTLTLIVRVQANAHLGNAINSEQIETTGSGQFSCKK